MFKPLGVAVAALLLVSCGGGGGDTASRTNSIEPLASLSAPVQAKRRGTARDLVAQAASVVNTTTLDDQTLRTIGATSDGGYAVAWISTGGGLSMQAYDDDGARAGSEVHVPVSTSWTAVLTDGSLVVVYTSTGADASGVYFQLFGKDGTRLAETQVTQVNYSGPKTPLLGFPRVVALSNGGFVVSSAVRYPQTGGPTITGLSLSWFDSQGQAIGPPVIVGDHNDFTELRTYGIAADAHGGLTVSATYMATSGSGSGILNKVIHFDANHVSTTIAGPSENSLELLPLEDGYLLFTSGTDATVQRLDSLGRPVGAPRTVAFPYRAIELADGTYVLISSANGAYTVQRFSTDGESIGQPLPIDTHGGAPEVAALAESGLVAAWTAPGVGGDADVYAQRFIERRKGRKEACSDSAKDQDLPARARGAPVDACMVSNAGFERGMTDWADWGNATVVSGQASSGTSALSVGPAAGGAGQLVAGIVPGNTYRLTARAKVGAASETVYVGVDFLDDQGIPFTQNSVLVTSTSYMTANLDVVAPPNAVRALVFVWKNAGSGVAYVDDFAMTDMGAAAPMLPVSGNVVVNGGLESGLANWMNWGNTSTAGVPAAAGSNAAQVGTGAGGFGQDVSGIVAGQRYRLSALAKVSNAAEVGYLGVMFMDQEGTGLRIQNVVIRSTTYSTVQADVTAPPGATRALVFVWKNAGDGLAFVDEVSLAQVTATQ